MTEWSLDFISGRRSVLKFDDRDIEQEKLDRILYAALRAPAPGDVPWGGFRGIQPYSIIVVRDRARRSQLNAMLAEGHETCIEDAPVSLVFCVDIHRLNRWAELRGGIPHYRGIGILWVALRGTFCAAQNALMAAYSLGLGGQYIQEIAWQPYETLNLLSLPEQVLPVAMIIVGYAAERPRVAPSLPLEAVVHYEKYSDPDDKRLLSYYKENEDYFNDWLSWLPADSRIRGHIEEAGAANLAQWLTMVAYTDGFFRWRDDVLSSNLTRAGLQ
jgi:FMN reductase (NADPH)